MKNFDELTVEALNSDDESMQLEAITNLRKYVSVLEPDVEKILDLEVLPRIIKLMLLTDCTEFQLEAAWILTNIASG